MGFKHFHCTNGCEGVISGDRARCVYCGRPLMGCNYEPEETVGPVDVFPVDVGWQERACRECGEEVTYLGNKPTPDPDENPHDDATWLRLPTYVCTACLYMYQIKYQPEPEIVTAEDLDWEYLGKGWVSDAPF